MLQNDILLQGYIKKLNLGGSVGGFLSSPYAPCWKFESLLGHFKLALCGDWVFNLTDCIGFPHVSGDLCGFPPSGIGAFACNGRNIYFCHKGGAEIGERMKDVNEDGIHSCIVIMANSIQLYHSLREFNKYSVIN